MKRRFDPAQEAQLEEVIENLNMGEEDAKTLRSLTRLLVGGSLLGWDELLAHLNSWESSAEETRSNQESRTRTPSAEAAEPPSTVLRYAVLGLMFEAQDRWVRRNKAVLRRASRTTDTYLGPLLNRLETDPRLQPARSRFERFVKRGETVAGRWVARGRNEEAHSRDIATVAAQQGFNSSMEQLGSAPALQDLVRKQSAGLTQDAVDEVRARTVTADLLAEQVARTVLRRKQRDEHIPSPDVDEPEETPSVAT